MKSFFVPNSPITNNFSAIEVLQDGRLVGEVVKVFLFLAIMDGEIY